MYTTIVHGRIETRRGSGHVSSRGPYLGVLKYKNDNKIYLQSSNNVHNAKNTSIQLQNEDMSEKYCRVCANDKEAL